MTVAIIVLSAVLLVVGLLIRFNALWIYRVLDRATRNSTTHLPEGYMEPEYYRTGPGGRVDTSVRWPGWDGWYFVVMPDDARVPTQMARCSIMTGLYGLEGIDNYDRLTWKLDTLSAVEHLTLVPTLVTTPGGYQKQTNLSQNYLPKEGHLRMELDELDVAVMGGSMAQDEALNEYGRIWGKWPRYRFRFLNPESEIRIDLTFEAERVIWWADIPGLFTYFSIFGHFEGHIVYRHGTQKPDPQHITGDEERYPIRGSGSFEHGFGRQLVGANRLAYPFRLLKRIIPSFRPIRYHFDQLFSPGSFQGGIMQASAFGIEVRNRGGFFLEGRYHPIHSVLITYLDEPEPDLVAARCPDRPPIAIYRKWHVVARTDAGVLEYTATRAWTPTAIATSMSYYHFIYRGTYEGIPLEGRGYGEYVHL